MNPILLGLLGAALSFAAGTWYGTGLGEDREYAKRAREDAIIKKVQDTATQSAADAIAKIKVRNTTIHQEVQREVKTDVRYVECRHTPAVFEKINEALTGVVPVAAPSAHSSLKTLLPEVAPAQVVSPK